MEKVKKSKTKVVLIILVIGLLALTSFYVINQKIKVKNSKFITIINPTDTYLTGVDEFKAVRLYDENFNVVETKSIKDGGYYWNHFETDDKYYLLGGNSFLSIDKKTKKTKEVENNFLEGMCYKIEEYDGDFILLDQITRESDGYREYKVHDVGNFKGDKIKTFKGTKPAIKTLVKANERYYAISSDELAETYGEISKKYIEVFDDEGNFLYSKEIENPTGYYEFFKRGDNVYLIVRDDKVNLFKFDLEKEEIEKEPIMSVQWAVFCQDGEDLYLEKGNKVMKVNLDNLELEKVFDSTDYDGNKEEDTEVGFFTTKNFQVVILSKKIDNYTMSREDIYIRSKGEKEFKKAEGASIINDLSSGIFVGDFE